MKPFRVLAKNHTAEEAEALLELAVNHGAFWFEYIEGIKCSVDWVAFEVDYDKCEFFGVSCGGDTRASLSSYLHSAPLLTYEQAEAHIKASKKQ